MMDAPAQPDTIDEIFDSLLERQVLVHKIGSKYIEEAKQALADFIKREVIRSDEFILGSGVYQNQRDISTRNILKSEQRTRVDTLLTSNEGKE